MTWFEFPSGVFVVIDQIYKLERAQEFMIELKLDEPTEDKKNLLMKAYGYMFDISEGLSDQIKKGILERNDEEELEAYVEEMPAVRMRGEIRRALKILREKNHGGAG